LAKKSQHINIPSTTESLSTVRKWITNLAEQSGFDDKSIQELTLAVDEACSNVVRHAYPNRDDGEVRITCKIDKKGMIVTIQDQGKGFIPDSYKEPSLSDSIKDRRGGGYGVMLIRKLMDEVEYRTRNHKNEVRMTKHRTMIG